MKYDKLVRDRIPEIIKDKGQEAIVHTAEESEYRTKLREKLNEEIAEFDENPSAGEIADILEVIEALAKLHNISWQEVEDYKKKKYQERGGFDSRIILDETK